MRGVRVHGRACEVHAAQGGDDPGPPCVLADVPAVDDVLARRGDLVVERDREQVAALAAGEVVHGEVACARAGGEVGRDEVGAARRAGAGGGPVAPEGEGAEGELLELARGERDERAIV